MSVYKSKRGVSAIRFIEVARQLEVHTLACCVKSPKRYTFFLTTEIMRLASEIHERVKTANTIFPVNKHEAQLRRDEFTMAYAACSNLDSKLILLYDIIKKEPDKEKYKWIDNAMKEWSKLICEEKDLIKGIKKSDRQRYKDLKDEDHDD